MPDETPLQVTLLRVGHCIAPEALTACGAPWRMASFPAGVVVIRHPEAGNILFDTGYGAAFFDATRGFPERIYRWLTPVRLRDDETLPVQLARLGVTRPDMVVLSHLHADHVAGLFDLDTLPSRICTSQAAIAGLDAPRIASLRAGCPYPLRDRLRALGMDTIEACPAVDLDALGSGYDLLGDGSMVAVPLAGHGTGQFGLYLPTTTDGPMFLVADAAWSVAALHNDTPPPDRTLCRLGDRDRYHATFAALRRLGRSQPNLRIVPSHCPMNFPEGINQ